MQKKNQSLPWYLFQSGEIWNYTRAFLLDTRIIGFAEDRAGKLHVLTNEIMSPNGNTGKVFRLVERT